MTLLAFGLNHQTAPLPVREKVAFAPETMLEALSDLARQAGVNEALILSTCNRTELYVDVESGAETVPRAWLLGHHELDARRLDEFLYRHADNAAVRHLFRVATGLDSMVLGEPQILGQVKDAYQLARDAGTLRAPMERLLQQTFAVAKRVRTETRIGANPVSVAFTAVRLAERLFADSGRGLRAADWRGRNDGAGRAPSGRIARAAPHRRQPHAGKRAGAGRAFFRLRHHAWPTCRGIWPKPTS